MTQISQMNSWDPSVGLILHFSERPERPKHVSPGQSGGAKPHSAALGQATPNWIKALKERNSFESNQ